MTSTIQLTVEEETVFSEVASILTAVIADYCIGIPLSPETTIQSDLDLESFDIVRFGLALSERYGESVNMAAYLSEMDFELLPKLMLGDIARYVTQQIHSQESLSCE
jgi:acyl carrier protein